jgi:hypothetical protein
MRFVLTYRRVVNCKFIMPSVSNDNDGPYRSAGLLSASTQRVSPFSDVNSVSANDKVSQPSGRVSAKGAATTASAICKKPALE